MYINGELKTSSTSYNTNMANLNAPLIVGATINGTSPIQEFVGDISICRLYGKHFSQAEASQNFNTQKSRFEL